MNSVTGTRPALAPRPGGAAEIARPPSGMPRAPLPPVTANRTSGSTSIAPKQALVRPDAARSKPTAATEVPMSVGSAIGPSLRSVLGGVDPLEGVTDPAERRKMHEAVRKYKLQADLGQVDPKGNLRHAFGKTLTTVYAPAFGAHEAVPAETIQAAQHQRQKDRTHLEGDRFTLMFTGVDPADPQGRRKPVAFAQGGTLRVADDACVTYDETWAVDATLRKDGQGSGLLSTLMGFGSAVSIAAARKWSAKEGRDVAYLGSLWESPAVGTGGTPAERAQSAAKASMYAHKGGLAVVGVDASGRQLPVHARPALQPGDGPPVARQLNFRPHDSGASAAGLTKSQLERLSQDYDKHYAAYAATGRDGVNDTKIRQAAALRQSWLDQVQDVRLVPADQAPSAPQLAACDPLLAKAVADNFRLRGPGGKAVTYQDMADPSLRNVVSAQATLAYMGEQAR
jgi:hypothetical protein